MIEDKLRNIIEYFGKQHQIIKLGEEVGELNKAILRYEDGYTRTTGEIYDEIADVYVMLEQIRLMYKLDDLEIATIIQMKIDRTLDRYNIKT